MENDSEVLSGLVLGRIRDGRCRYDPQVKQELVRRCLQPGVSVAAMAMRHGVNANLLRKWITHWRSRNAMQQAVWTLGQQDMGAVEERQRHTLKSLCGGHVALCLDRRSDRWIHGVGAGCHLCRRSLEPLLDLLRSRLDHSK